MKSKAQLTSLRLCFEWFFACCLRKQLALAREVADALRAADKGAGDGLAT